MELKWSAHISLVKEKGRTSTAFVLECHLLVENAFWLDEEKKAENRFLLNNFFELMFSFFSETIVYTLVAFIRLYQLLISPFFAPSCRFHPTCSNYAIECLQSKSLRSALVLILKRIARCHPFSQCGFDPVKK